MGLVAYPKSQREQNPIFVKLTRSGRWCDLADAFEKEAFSLYGLSDHSMVTQTLQTGISVLKTSLCEEKNEDELFCIGEDNDVEMNESALNENGKCPTCDPKMRQLGMDLPNSLHTLTQISCSLTGKAMGDSNPPVYLPSGFLICEQAKLTLIKEANNGETLD